MKSRLANKNANSLGEVFLLQDNPDEEALIESVKQLEDCVKNGLFYQAAELSDWIAFIAEEKLRTPSGRVLDRKLKIERLKRLGYLGFIEAEKACRRRFCIDFELAKILASNPSPNENELRHHLYTAIGHTLWNIDDINEFDDDINICNKLYNGFTSDYSYRYVVDAFLHGLKGRRAYLANNKSEEVINQFETGLEILDSNNARGTRTGLHLIICYAKHLMLMYEKSMENDFEIGNKIDLLFYEFERCRLGSLDKDRPAPLKTLLQIHFLVLKLHKLTLDSKSINEIEHTQTELLFTAVMLGLGNLNPCPPLLKDIYQFFSIQQNLFDANSLKVHLKEKLRKISPKSMEKLAAIYFRMRGYEVEELPEDTQTFDLIAKFKHESFTSTVGVQVKRVKNGLTKKKYDEWVYKANNYERKDEISGVTFFLIKKQHRSISGKIDTLNVPFPKLTNDVNFLLLDNAIDWMWDVKVGCLSEIYGLISQDNSIN